MTLPEEAGKVANSTIEALKNQPMLLGLILLNIIFMVGGCYLLIRNREVQAKQFEMVMSRCYALQPGKP